MEKGGGGVEVEEKDGEEDLPQPEWPGWQLPAGCDGLSQLRHGCGGVDDQLPGCPELVARMEKLKQLSLEWGTQYQAWYWSRP